MQLFRSILFLCASVLENFCRFFFAFNVVCLTMCNSISPTSWKIYFTQNVIRCICTISTSIFFKQKSEMLRCDKKKQHRISNIFREKISISTTSSHLKWTNDVQQTNKIKFRCSKKKKKSEGKKINRSKILFRHNRWANIKVSCTLLRFRSIAAASKKN